MISIRELTQNQLIVMDSIFGGLFLILLDKHKKIDLKYVSMK